MKRFGYLVLLVMFGFALTFTSCKKCETCTNTMGGSQTQEVCGDDEIAVLEASGAWECD